MVASGRLCTWLFILPTSRLCMYGEKIRLIREMRGFSQENVAAKLGIMQNAYSRIENNQTKLESSMLVKIAEVLCKI